MPSSYFLAKLLENKVLGMQMKFETKLRNYIISKEQKYFVRTTSLNKSILFDKQNIFVTSTEQFCQTNKETQQTNFSGVNNFFSYKFFTSQMDEVNYINLPLRNVIKIIENTLIKAKNIIIYQLLIQFIQQHISVY